MNKKNRIVVWLCLALSVLMVVSVMPVGAISVALESNAPFGGVTATPNSEGAISVNTGNPDYGDLPHGQVPEGYTPTGTAIGSTADFNNMKPDGTYYLTTDITVDTTYAGFAGVLDGNGHTVTTTVPLFNSPKNATIKNLKVAGDIPTIHTANINVGNTGAVASGTAVGCNFFNILNTANVTKADDAEGATHRASGIAGRTAGYTIFERCTNEGAMKGNNICGGITALASADADSQLVMINCVNKGDITSVGSNAAGIAAAVECPLGVSLLYNCRNEGNVTGKAAGGMIAYTTQNAAKTVSVRLYGCTNAGEISSTANNVGGMIASSNTPVTIEQCTNEETGKVYVAEGVTTKHRAGGMIGSTGNVAVLITDCVNNAYIEGTDQTGGIAGVLGSSNVTVRRCTNNGAVTSRLNYCGGIVGRADLFAVATDLDVLFEDCTNTGKVSAYSGNVGGIYGFTQANVTFIRCTNKGEVTYRTDAPDANAINAGGIAGAVQGPVVFEDCRNEGNVTAKAQVPFTANSGGNAGGIIGAHGSSEAMGTSKLYRCVNTGNVTGGLGVTPTSHNACYAGGFIGYQYCSSSYSRPEITYCMSTGNVKAANQVSYAIGYMNSTAALFTDNVFAGTLTSEGFSSGLNATNSPVRTILGWNQGNTVPAGHYTRNYVLDTFDGVVINNKAATGAGIPVTMEGYPYTYTSETNPADLYNTILAGAEEEISTPEQFAAMKADGRYKLTADITLTATYATPFCGVLNGNGHTLTVSAPVFAMLYASAEVKDLTLAGEITGMTGQVGALAQDGGGRITRVVNRVNVTASDGNIGGFIGRCNQQFAYFTDCVNYGNVNVSSANNAAGFIAYTNYTSYFTNCTNNGAITGGNHVGGIVAESQVWGTTYIGCVNTGKITNTYTGTGGKGTAGIQAYNGNNCVYLTDCFNSGAVTGVYAAGMIGDTAKGAVVTGCVNTGNIVSTGVAAGGIMNHHKDNGAAQFKMTNCVNTGDISGKSNGSGGIGGIVGTCMQIKATVNITFISCINAGSVSGTAEVGGIAGRLQPDNNGSATAKSTTTLDKCINLGEVKATTGTSVGALLGYVWGSSTFTGISVTNCIVAGTVTTEGARCGAICGYMNSDMATIKNNVIATTLNATATHLYYASNGASITAKANIANNAVVPGSAMYDAQKGNGATTIALGTNSTSTVSMTDFAIDSAVTKNMLLIAGILPDVNGNFGVAVNRLFPGESAQNKVGIYDQNGTEIAVVGSLSQIDGYLADGVTVKLLADYYSAVMESLVSNGVSYTLDGNGHKMYSHASDSLLTKGTRKYGLAFAGSGTVTVKDLTLYSLSHGVSVGYTDRVGELKVILENVSIYVDGSNEKGCIAPGSGLLALQNYSALSNVEIKGDNSTFRNVTGTLIYVDEGAMNISGGNYYPGFYGLDLGSEEAVVNITGGTFKGLNKQDTVINVPKGTVNISGGRFENNGMCVARVLGGVTKNEAGADNTITTETNGTLNILGGVFVATSGNNAAHCAVIRCGGGTTYGKVNIFGGTFVNQKAASAQVIFKNNTCSSLTITGGKFLASADQKYFMNTNGNANVTTASGYTPVCSHGDVETGAYSGTYTFEGKSYKVWTLFGATDSRYAMETLEGAQVRMTTGSTGLRFISLLSAEKVAAAKALAGAGGKVSYGTVIAPMDYVAKADAFTMEALDAATALQSVTNKYVDIAAENGLIEDESGNVEIRAALTNIKAANYTRAFAAVAYVKVETAGGVVSYYYGDFDGVNNVRAVRQVAEAALADVKEEKSDVYRYAVTVEGKTVYSRYTESARNVMKTFVA